MNDSADAPTGVWLHFVNGEDIPCTLRYNGKQATESGQLLDTWLAKPDHIPMYRGQYVALKNMTVEYLPGLSQISIEGPT